MHPAPLCSLFEFLAHYLDLSKATDSILLFPIMGMDQDKLSFSKSSLLVSRMTLLLQELMEWLQEEPSKGVTWTARRGRTPGADGARVHYGCCFRSRLQVVIKTFTFFFLIKKLCLGTFERTGALTREEGVTGT